MAPSSGFMSVPFDPEDSVHLEVTYSITYETTYPSVSLFEIWIPRLNTWNSGTSEEFVGQNSTLQVINHPDFYDEYYFDSNDVYGNSYDFYNLTMNPSTDETLFEFSSTYDIILEGQSPTISENLTMDIYDTSSELYDFYTSYEPYYETNDSVVLDVLENIITDNTSIKDILESVYLFVVGNMTYSMIEDTKTTKEILSSMEGDCSEFSTLMVGLLRAAGIPARKVLGLGLIDGNVDSPSLKLDMKAGDTWYYQAGSEYEIPGHAWVQYYVPELGLGWVSADPTWGQPYVEYGEESALQYLYNMDYVHLITTVGGWYEDGIDPELFYDKEEQESPEMDEFPFIYPVGNAPANSISFDFRIDFEVISFNQSDPSSLFDDGILIYVLASSPFLILVVVVMALIKKRSRAKKDFYY
ncbi:MAG: transglutaminase-like domain-containing protein [Promethearchaeota archaeon]